MRRSLGVRGGIPRIRASRSAAPSATSGSTETSRCSSSTTRRATTTTSTARRTCSATALPSEPSTARRAWSGRLSSSPRLRTAGSRRAARAVGAIGFCRATVRRRPVRRRRRRRAPAVLRRAYPRARLGRAVVARERDDELRDGRRRTSKRPKNCVENTDCADRSPSRAGSRVPDLAITYSELEAYLACPRSYLLRNELGFMPPCEVRARLRQRRPPRDAGDRRAGAGDREAADA